MAIDHAVFVVFGASGDLAKKKTFPALFGLYRQDELPKTTKIFGYARSKLTNEEFHDKFRSNLKLLNDSQQPKIDQFLGITEYFNGSYDDPEAYKRLELAIQQFEKSQSIATPNRIYYLALPPSVFATVAANLKKYNHNGKVKLIVEKPFGHDLPSAKELQAQLAPLFSEDELFRIDHYLGKELVKNLLVLRFGNEIFNASWNKNHIQSIQISFKEPFGTEGRGGYFDSIGIIRDVIQNHLLQVLTLLTMERPTNFKPESIRDEKVKVLKAFAPIDQNDILVGQYVASRDGSKPGYLDDSTVNPDSKCITYAAIGLKIENERWDGVPIVVRAGKALNESKVEVRIQFKQVAKGVFNSIQKNELVLRIQPKPAVYLKLNSKIPGLSNKFSITDLDLTYGSRYNDFWIPEAYESLIRDALHDEHSNFVRDDELELSWGLFTPLLNYLEGPNAPTPLGYHYGDRGVPGLEQFLAKHGYEIQDRDAYQWPVTRPDILEKI
ncbi:glucose-6-phosphate dehydrogenase [Saccharomycopsis crataegensis]|uniref:Glucose-6-phosphate 1-dehydrogenase n=1 Tax=Saccharomycopsis crataegensis TaxID=43959 RepID=A0AAV5QLX3_9ASCO|nr:glucose-6-phosphate dehydrogenase [Saccharomycopsis crataegensis]